MVAMSGGVDSSAAALLLKERGYVCAGATMKLFDNGDIADDSPTCCSARDVQDARSVANKLGIDHYTFNFSDDFRERVIDKFTGEYAAGNTPNPCIDCNRYLKFGKLLRTADMMEISHIATGHYAIIERGETSGRWLLKKAADKSKDQSYVLYMLTQEQLSRTLLPLGEFTKSEAREIASRAGFLNAAKRESQDICFVPDGKYIDFIARNGGGGREPGDFIDSSGRIIGRHKGLARYTIGQRKNLGVSFSEKLFVISKNAHDNTVTLGREDELYSKELYAADFNLISRERIDGEVRTAAMTRYRQTEYPCTVQDIGGGVVRIVFDEPQKAAAAGQALVLYDGDSVLGGGTIIGKEI
ncbi:tRNA-specific 2-thiouridylase MnmA [Synergistales bacterium]|nr:tRNA-specific 2-thiouridylase MnmA [Synergistales bacterium]